MANDFSFILRQEIASHGLEISPYNTGFTNGLERAMELWEAYNPIEYTMPVQDPVSEPQDPNILYAPDGSYMGSKWCSECCQRSITLNTITDPYGDVFYTGSCDNGCRMQGPPVTGGTRLTPNNPLFQEPTPPHPQAPVMTWTPYNPGWVGELVDGTRELVRARNAGHQQEEVILPEGLERYQSEIQVLFNQALNTVRPPIHPDEVGSQTPAIGTEPS